MLIPSTIDRRDLDESIKLSRSFRSILDRRIGFHDLWLLALPPLLVKVGLYCHVVQNARRLLVLFYTILLGFLMLRELIVLSRRVNRLQRANRTERYIELTTSGIRFQALGQPTRLLPWSKISSARIGHRVLVLHYAAARKLRLRRKFLIVPVHGLTTAERRELVLNVPEELRTRSIRRAVEQPLA